MSLHTHSSKEPQPYQANGTELPKTSEALIRLCRQQGWQIEYTTAGHTKLTSPHTGKTVIAAKRMGDYRSVMNLRSQLKRNGLKPAEGPQKRIERPERAPTIAPPMAATLGDIAKAHDEEVTTLPEVTAANLTKTPEHHEMKSNGTNGVNGKHADGWSAGTMPPSPPTERKKSGEVLSAVLAAVARADLGKGVTCDDILSRMQVMDPTTNARRVGISMAGACKGGYLLRRSHGRYSVSPTSMTPQLRAIAAAPEVIDTLTASVPSGYKSRTTVVTDASTVVPVTDETTDDDIATLDRALVALADIERVIHKHKAIAVKNSELVALLSKFTNSGK